MSVSRLVARSSGSCSSTADNVCVVTSTLRQRAQLDKFAGSEFEQPKAGPKGEGQDARSDIHFHMLMLDGVYQENIEQPQRKPRLHRARAPTSAQLTQLADTIAHRVCRHLVRQGWLEGEDESAFLSDSAGGDDGMDGLRMSSITYRIATGTHAGRKVATLQTTPADDGSPEGDAGKVGGFSLQASRPRRTRARSSNACAAPSRARRSARSAYQSRRRARCVTRSRRRGRTARRTWSLSRWS